MRPSLMLVLLLGAAGLFACGGGSGGGGPTCTNTCPTAETTKCSGTQVQTCRAGSDGCLAWSTAAACPNSGLCSSTANACVADACGGIPEAGVCASSTSVSYCGVPTGEGTPRALTYSCVGGESCQVQSGRAQCILTSACRTGDSQCADASTLRTCSGGNWTSSTCSSSCGTSTLGSFCRAPGALTTLTGTVLFQARMPNAGMTDWSATPVQYPAPLFLVISQGAAGLYDAVYTSGASGSLGTFSIQVPQSPTAQDQVVVAAAADDGFGGLAFAVASPGLASGQYDIGSIGTPALASWVWSTAGITNGQSLIITEGMGSAAANVYFNLLVAYLTTYGQYNKVGPSLIAWVGPGATWTCGKCFAPMPTTVFGMPFASQLWLSGDLTDQSYWSDAVNEHEMGHWVMASYGVSPLEGGPHFLGKPTFPGQAWSEGWATWFSSQVRGDPHYFDKQSGSFFWLDLSADVYSSGSALVPPVAALGLLQLLDENRVSAMLWSLSSSSATAGDSMFQALASPRMTTPRATRGYTRHQWAFDNAGNYINVVDTGQDAPSLPDFLDALDCAGFPRSAIDAATTPATLYPYPSASPICN